METVDVDAGVENVGECVVEIADDGVRVFINGLCVQTVHEHFVRHRDAVLFEEVEGEAVSACGTECVL